MINRTKDEVNFAAGSLSSSGGSSKGVVLCFGELLLRFSPALKGEWIKSHSMPVFTGGAELNVAQALALWNIPVKYFTALPDNYLSKEITGFVSAKNIDTTSTHYSGNRIGAYYLPQGADLKNAGVIYDRANSSFAELKPGMINWDDVLKDVNWFHFSAICPALSQDTVSLCEEALQACEQKGITISVDLNYRSKLWQYGKQPPEVMPQLMKYCKVVMSNIWSTDSLLGIPAAVKESAGKTKDELLGAAGKSMKQIHLDYPGVTTIAYTFRLEDYYFAVLQHGPEMVISVEYPMRGAIDKSGSGDCFMAGLIYGLYHHYTPQAIVDFATAAAYQKLFVKGDATDKTADQIKNFIQQHEQRTASPATGA
ncbi:MAG: sugar kinase [Chitinophagaceae bacterium]|nr:sugar kinase [Chitinophagaceae bacterium]